jgi:glutamate-1-semialdehyde 2,1-aminomutase
MTTDAYTHLDRLNERILKGCQTVIDEHRLPAYSVGIGAKGCVTFSTEKVVDYPSFKRAQDPELSDLAWLYNMNRGVFMTPGREEEWTLSVTHDDAAVDRYVEVFAELAHDLTSTT